MLAVANPPRHRTLAAATAVLWLVAWFAWTADWFVEPMDYAADRALRRIPICLAGALLCWLAGRPVFRGAGSGARRRFALAATFSVVASLALSALGEVVFYAYVPHWGRASWGNWLGAALTDVWVFAAWSALYFALEADATARDTRLALADAHADLLEAQNLALVRQIDPHFLFNALNTVSGLIGEGETARADRTTLALARLLRGAFERDPPPFHTLAEELRMQGAYLEVQHARFPDRFALETHIPPPLADWPVPTLILQPLIENVFTHGVSRSSARVTLRITAREADGDIVLSVSDDAASDVEGRHGGIGVGLDNVARRLATLYGPLAVLESGPQAGGGWRVSLRIPGAAP